MNADELMESIEFSNELNRQVSEALWWLAQFDSIGAERLEKLLNNSKDRILWWQLMGHLKLVVESDIEEIPEEGKIQDFEIKGDC